MKSVKMVLSRDHLTTNLIRKFARKARAYTCAYFAFDNNLLAKSKEVLGLTGQTTLPDIEKLQKIFRCHRCALDFETKFCITTEK